MNRGARIALRVLAVCVILLLSAFIGLNWYLRSESARQLATEELSKVLGGRVTVQSIDAGFGSTAVGIVIPAEPSAAAPAPDAADAAPILVGTVRANVGPVGLAAGTTPDRITVENARVHLRFAENGDMLTTLPSPPKDGGSGGPLPAIDVTSATVTIEQVGRPAFTISGVDLTARETNGRLALAGSAADDRWGRWTLAGDFAADGTDGTVHLDTADPVSVTMPMLASVPFVPAETWKEVQLEGATTGKLVLTKAGDDLAYDVELKPRGAKITIPEIGLTVTDATATVGVDGDKVTLSGFRGTTASGTVSADGAFNYAATPSDLTMKVKADGLVMNQLPKAWKLPPTLEGRLRGQADMTLTFAADGLKTSGSGAGQVDDARWNDIPIEKFEMKLVSDEHGYHFESGQPTARRPSPWLTSAILLAVMLQTPADAPADAPAEPKADEPAKADAGPTYFEANLNLKDVDLGDLIAKLKLDLPIRVGGKVSVSVKAGIPIDSSDDLKAYRIDGTVTMPTLTLQDLTMTGVTAKARLRDGVLELTELTGAVTSDGAGGRPGTFAGRAKYGIEPQTELSATLQVDALPVGEILQALPDLGGLVAGRVTGSFDLTVPADKLDDVTAIRANAKLTSPAITALGRKLTDATVVLKVADGTASLSRSAATVEGLPVAGTGSVGLRAPFDYTANVDVAEAELVSLQALVPEATLPVAVSGKLATKVKATGTASPFTVSASGSANATDLALGSAEVESLAFDWAATTDELQLKNVKAAVYDGTVTGAATVPFADGRAGAFAVEIKAVDAAALTRNVPSLPVKLIGELSGTANGTIPASRPGGARPVDVAIDLAAPKMRVQGIPTERLRGQVGYKPGALTYSLTGDALGGNFDVNGTYPIDGPAKPAGDPPAVVPPRADDGASGGSVRIRNVDLGRLSEALNVAALRPLRGRLELAADYAYDPDTGRPVGGGSVRLVGFGWGTGQTSDLTGTIRALPNAIELNDLSGRLADGQLRGRVRYNLANPGRSYFLVTLDRAEAGRLLEPLDIPGFDGRMSLSLRGRIGREFSGTGTLTGSRVSVASTTLGEARVPFTWRLDPGTGGELTVRDGYATVGRGRVRGQVTARWGRTATVTGTLRFIEVDVASVLGSYGQGSRANGRFDFNGRNVKAVADLTGTLTGKFGGGGNGLTQLPLFRALTPYVSGFSAFSRAKEGEVRGRLGNGQFRVEKFTLTSTNAALYAEGTVGVANGRLDLDVTAQTGQIGPSPLLLRLVRLIPVAGPIPLGVLLDINDFLSNRIVRLKVTGTSDRPVVRVNTAKFLAENAARYFISRYSPVPLPTPGAP